ncbi:MAG: EAL domain-containing protein [Acetobacterium woodii]|nr:EAL domain-containing protein [Acetobacterium woodii]
MMLQIQISMLFYLTFILYVCLGFFCLFLNNKERLNQVFFWLCMSYAVWAFAFAISNSLNDIESVLIWRRIAALGWGSAFSLMLHFMLVLTEKHVLLRSSKVLIVIYLPAVITISVFALFPDLANAQYNLVQTGAGWGNIPINNFWDIFYNLYYLSFSLITLVVLFNWYRTTLDRQKQQQAFWLLLAFSVSVALGTASEMLANNLLSYKIPSIAPILILIPVMAFAYDIWKYKLLMPEVENKTVKLSEILSNDAHLALFRYIAIVFVVISILNLGHFFFHPTVLWRGMLISTINLALGLCIYSLPFSGLSTPNQDRIMTMILAVAIPLALFKPLDNLANTVWCIPLVFMMTTIIFNRKKMFALFALVTLISGIIILFWKPDQGILIGTPDYLARLFICLVAILLAGYTNRIYIARLKENDRQIGFQKMISQVTTHFVSVSASNFEKKVGDLLKTSGEFTNSDRAYVGMFSDETDEFCYTYEWLAGDNFPPVRKTGKIHQSAFPWCIKQLLNNQIVYLESIDKLPDEEKDEQERLRKYQVSALILIPIQSRDKIIGFLGFDQIKKDRVWRMDEPELLRVLANILADAIGKIENEKEIHNRAYYDTLTGLPNRILFHERLEKSIETANASGSHLGVVFVDIDGFKEVNDTMGHDWGDHLLNRIGRRLSDSLRKGDSMARFGGDEFLILVANLNDRKDLVEVANRVMSVFHHPVRLGDQEFYISGSGGIAVYPQDGETVQSLIKHADLAMYDAKKNGKGQVVFCSEAMKKDVREKMILTNSLYRALERQELYLNYQPMFAQNSLEVVGIEALLRWDHPELGTVAPEVFIPFAEQNGLINSIGEWVLMTACAQNKDWQERGFKPVPVAVNLSLEQFGTNTLLTMVKHCLEKTGLKPEYLELEITETIAMEESKDVIQTLHQLNTLGVSISIDDFGTEFSSLSQLKDLPVDRIKIDESFIRGIGVNPKDESIITVMIHLAQKLGLSVVAEGVETAVQLQYLKVQGCDEVQGYYCGRPMAAGPFEHSMAAGTLIADQGQISS